MGLQPTQGDKNDGGASFSLQRRLQPPVVRIWHVLQRSYTLKPCFSATLVSRSRVYPRQSPIRPLKEERPREDWRNLRPDGTRL